MIDIQRTQQPRLIRGAVSFENGELRGGGEAKCECPQISCAQFATPEAQENAAAAANSLSGEFAAAQEAAKTANALARVLTSGAGISRRRDRSGAKATHGI